jgi:ubiquinone biosynthesis protein COQ9
MIIDSFENKQKIINQLLEISVYEGWNDNALKLAFKKAEIDDKYLEIIFPDKIFSAIEFISEQNCQNIKKLLAENNDFYNNKIHQKISYLLYNFLTLDLVNKLAYSRLLNFYVAPQNLLSINQNKGLRPSFFAVSQAYYVANFMWNLIEDKSTDINFFTKRIILSKIIIRSFIYYINHDNNADLQKFIDAQILNILKFAKIKKQVKNKVNNFKNRFDDSVFCQKNNQDNNIIDVFKKLPFIRLINHNIFK